LTCYVIDPQGHVVGREPDKSMPASPSVGSRSARGT
jgi:hypothetical protein